MKSRLFFLLTLLALCLPIQLSAQMPIIFETDMGNDIDDAWALDMLYKYADAKRVKLEAIMLNKEGDAPVRFIDLMNTWYGYPRVPIGRSLHTNQSTGGNPNYTEVVTATLTPEGKPYYKYSIKDYTKLPDAVTLYRKLLAKAKDNSITIVSVGFSTNLAALLNTKADKFSPLSGPELVARKVKSLVVMAGHMENKKFAEYNVINDIPACQRVYHEWPTPIVTTAWELGAIIKYPAQSVREDFTWTKHHPVVESVHYYLKELRDHPTWDMTAVLYAVEGASNFFTLSEPGDIRVTDEGYTLFTPNPKGTRLYLKTNEAQRQRVLDAMRDLVIKKPLHQK